MLTHVAKYDLNPERFARQKFCLHFEFDFQGRAQQLSVLESADKWARALKFRLPVQNVNIKTFSLIL